MTKFFKRNSKNALHSIFFLCILLLPAVNPSLAADKFVSDNFEITLRSGPRANSTIKKMLSSDTPLTVLEKKSKWIKVQSPEGDQGWVKDRYVMDEIPKSTRIKNLKDEIEKLQSEKNESQKLIANLKDENQELNKDLNKVQSQFKETKNKYEDLKSTAGQAMELKKNYKAAQKEMQKNKDKIDVLRDENSKLRSKIRLYWFIAGGSLVFVSAIIGFILGRLQRKKSKKVYF